MLENTKGEIKNGQSNETDNTGHTKHKMKTKQNKKYNTIFVGYHYVQTNTNKT